MESTKSNHVQTDDEPKMRSFGEELKSFFVGDDVFISYARGDSTGYALALANRLGENDFICYLDQYGTNPNDEIDERIKRKLRRSRVLILIGSQLAINSAPVRQEVELFKKTGRAIIPIDVDGAFRGSKLYEVVRGLPLAAEEIEVVEETEINIRTDKPAPAVSDHIVSTIDNLRKAPPSGRVVDRIKSTISYTKRTQLQRTMLWVGSVFLFVSVSFAVISLFVADRARASAAQERELADIARSEAQQAMGRAQSANDGALVAAFSQRIADIKSAVADDIRSDTEAREKIAELREAQATANAQQQERVAESLDEVERSARLIEERPAEALAVRATALSKTPDAVGTRGGLLNALKRYPHLESLIASNYNAPITRLSSALQGRVVAFAYNNYDSGLGNDTVAFYDTETRSIIPSPPVSIDREIHQLSCTPTGDLCAASTHSNIMVWQFKLLNHKLNVEPFPQTFHFPGDHFAPSSLAISNDKRLIATYNTPESILIWDLTRPIEEPKKPNLKDGCFRPTFALSPDNKTLVLACQFEVQFWDFNSLDVPLATIDFPGLMEDNVQNVVFSDDGKYVAVSYANGTVLLIDANTREVRGSPFKDAGPEITFARIKDSNLDCTESKDPSSNWPFKLYSDLPILVTSNSDGHMIYWSLQDCPTPIPILAKDQIDYPPGISSVTSLHGKANSFVVGGRDGALALWDMNAKPLLDSFYRGAYPTIDHIGFDKSGTLLSLNGGSSYSAILDFSGDVLAPIQSSFADNRLSSARFLPWVYAVSGSSVFITDLRKSRDQTSSVPMDANEMKFAAINANATMVAAVTDDNGQSDPVEHNNVVLWDLSKNKAKKRKTLEDPEDATCVVFSRDGKLLAVGYGTGKIAVWDIARGKKIRELKSALTEATFDLRRNPRVTALDFSADGRMIAASSDYSPLSLWDTKTGSLIGSLESGPSRSGDNATAIAFSPNGKKLITSSYEGMSVWDTDPHSWAQHALRIINRK